MIITVTGPTMSTVKKACAAVIEELHGDKWHFRSLTATRIQPTSQIRMRIQFEENTE